jgi:Na+-transporting methylmalonyl-CoA/oxaloacetate decarboxylase gamma subunit
MKNKTSVHLNVNEVIMYLGIGLVMHVHSILSQTFLLYFLSRVELKFTDKNQAS